MRVKLILPALTEAKSPFFRPIKYSLFPPLGLATLAAYLDPDDEIALQDEHVEVLDLDDSPQLVAIQVYITSAYRAYAIADHYRARGAHVCLGGLHVTSLPDEAARHASDDWDRYDTRHVVFRPARLTPGELEAGYWRAYRDFYRWGSIVRGAWAKDAWGERLRHVAYAGGWKKFEPLWDLAIRARRVTQLLPVLEGVLSGFGRHAATARRSSWRPSPPVGSRSP